MSNSTTSPDWHAMLPWAFAIALSGFGIMGSIGSILVGSLAVAGFFLFASGKIEFARPAFLTQWAIIIVVFVTVSLSVATYHHFAGRGFGNMFGRFAFLEFLPLVVLMAQINREKLLSAVEAGACIAALVTLLLAVYENQFSPFRVVVGAGNPGPFSVAMSVNYAFCLLAFARRGVSFKNLVFLAGAVAAALCVVLSGMRTMLPAIVILPLIAVWFGRTVRTTAISLQMRLTITAVAAIMAIGVSLLSAPRLVVLEESYQGLQQQQNYNSSLGHRIVMWRYAAERIPQRPLLGFGSTEGVAGMSDYSRNNFGFHLGKSHFHNFIVNALVVGGVVELTVLLMLLAAPFLVLWRTGTNDEPARYGRTFAVAVTLVFLCSGMLNILFAHDLMDHLYIVTTAMAARLAIPDKTIGQIEE